MKKYISIIAVLFCTLAKAQSVDKVKYSVQIIPRITDEFLKDTAFQMRVHRVWTVPHDTTAMGGSHVVLYNRKVIQVKEYNIDIPYSVLKEWLDDIVIDNYILTFLRLLRR